MLRLDNDFMVVGRCMAGPIKEKARDFFKYREGREGIVYLWNEDSGRHIRSQHVLDVDRRQVGKSLIYKRQDPILNLMRCSMGSQCRSLHALSNGVILYLVAPVRILSAVFWTDYS